MPQFILDKFTPPLSQPVFYVLLALSRGDLHGYGILTRVVDISQSSIVFQPGALYPLLKRLVTAELLADTGMHGTYDSDKPRKHYTLTLRGTLLLKSELRRLQHAVRIGEAGGLIDENELSPELQMLFIEQGVDAR